MKKVTYKNTYGNGEVRYVQYYVADEGKALTNDNGKTVWNCVAVDSADGWVEIDAPAADDEITDAEALKIITGGAT